MALGNLCHNYYMLHHAYLDGLILDHPIPYWEHQKFLLQISFVKNSLVLGQNYLFG